MPMQPDIQAFFDEATSTVTYLVSDPELVGGLAILHLDGARVPQLLGGTFAFRACGERVDH